MAKRQPPRPKSTANLPPGLAKYWAAKGVPATPSGGTSKSSSKKSSSKKSASKKSGRKSTSRKKK